MTSVCQTRSSWLPGCVCDLREWDVSGLELPSFRAFLPRKEKGPHRWEPGEYWEVGRTQGVA